MRWNPWLIAACSTIAAFEFVIRNALWMMGWVGDVVWVEEVARPVVSAMSMGSGAGVLAG